jgi:hypothetical protein
MFPEYFIYLETATFLLKEAHIGVLENALSAYRSLCALLAGDI